MTLSEDWDYTAKLASTFYVENNSKELLLYKFETDYIDNIIIFKGKIFNIPFKPHILCCRGNKKDKDIISQFNTAALKWWDKINTNA